MSNARKLLSFVLFNIDWKCDSERKSIHIFRKNSRYFGFDGLLTAIIINT